MFFASKVNPCACITELAMNLIYISSGGVWGTNFKGKTSQGKVAAKGYPSDNVTLRSHCRGFIEAHT